MRSYLRVSVPYQAFGRSNTTETGRCASPNRHLAPSGKHVQHLGSQAAEVVESRRFVNDAVRHSSILPGGGLEEEIEEDGDWTD